MKTIGIIGGLSWHSTAEYYRLINEQINQHCGGLHSAKCIIYSVDFAEIETLQCAGRWEEAGSIMVSAAVSLERAGADFILIAANTMHKLAPQVEAATNIPLLHIADAAAEAVKQQDLEIVGLLGTRYTMEDDFYISRLEMQGLQVLVPQSDEREIVHKVIFEELCLGEIKPESRLIYLQIINNLIARGAQAIILGCTEISLLVKPDDAEVPLLDTTLLHVLKAVEKSLN